MKRLLLALAAACSLLTAAAQQTPTYVYGIDFSLARVRGADESDQQFAEAFRRINQLLITEADKYDFARALRQPQLSVDIDPMLQRLDACGYERLRDTKHAATDEEVRAAIASYELEEQEGTGIVLVALLLDKPSAKALYEMVIFDIATREVRCTWRREHREPLLP